MKRFLFFLCFCVWGAQSANAFDTGTSARPFVARIYLDNDSNSSICVLTINSFLRTETQRQGYVIPLIDQNGDEQLFNSGFYSAGTSKWVTARDRGNLTDAQLEACIGAGYTTGSFEKLMTPIPVTGSLTEDAEVFGLLFETTKGVCTFKFEGLTNTIGTTDASCLTLKPVANAGDDQTVTSGVDVTLNGSVTDPDKHQNVTYNWTFPSGISIKSGAGTASPVFTAPNVGTLTTYDISFTVTDEFNVTSDADTVKITVNPAPTAVASGMTVFEGTEFTLDASGSSDPDNDPLAYSWTAPVGMTLVSGDGTATPSYSAPSVETETNFTFTLYVTEANGGVSETIDVIVTVKPNTAPVANAGGDQTVAPGAAVTLTGSGTDTTDNHAISKYEWTVPAGITLTGGTDMNSAELQFAAPTVSSLTTYTFSLVVTDELGAVSVADEVSVTVNPAPTAVASGMTVFERTEFTLDASGSSDPDNDSLAYSWTAPVGMTLVSGDGTSKPSYSAPSVETETNFTFTLYVTEANGGVSETIDVIVTVKPNTAPVAVIDGLDVVASRSEVTLDGTASSDVDGHSITYEWTAPEGMALDMTDPAKPTFTAPDLNIGEANRVLEFSLVVTDELGLASDPVTVTVTVTAPRNQAPVPVIDGVDTVASGAEVTLDGSASNDGDDQSLTYSWSSEDIDLTNETSASLTFTAPVLAAGGVNKVIQIVLTVNDGFDTRSVTKAITVIAPANTAPVADAGDGQEVASGAAVTLDGRGSSDADGHELTYQWIAPSGVTLSDATVAQPSFTAPVLAAGSEDVIFTFTLVVTDSLGLSSSVSSVTVRVIAAPTATITAAPTTLANTDPFDITVVFSSDVTGFDDLSADVTVGNGTATTIVGGPRTYTVTITPTGKGNVTVSIPQGAAVDAYGNPSGASGTIAIENLIADQTRETISNYIATRTNSWIANQRSVIGFLRQELERDFEDKRFFTANIGDTAGSLSTGVSVGRVWGELNGTWSKQSSYALATIGSHIQYNDNLLIGGMVEFDYADEPDMKTKGTGWAVGPYFVTKTPDQPFYLEGRLLYGQSRNTVTPLGTYSDTFVTDRLLAQLRTTGSFTTGRTKWLPLVDFTYSQDKQRGYTDSLGNKIAGQTFDVMQLSTGIDVETPIQLSIGELIAKGGASYVYSGSSGTVSEPSFERGRGQVRLGFEYRPDLNTTFQLDTQYDGIGSDYEANSIRLTLLKRF